MVGWGESRYRGLIGAISPISAIGAISPIGKRRKASRARGSEQADPSEDRVWRYSYE